MNITIIDDRKQLGKQAAQHGAALIRQAICARGEACIVVPTGASQIQMLECLVAETEIPWQRVTAFHLDEYVGLPIAHPASFRLFLWQRFVSRLPKPLAAFHYLDGEGDPQAECRRVGEIIRRHSIDVAFVGIGENGHLAFNDPPADFQTEEPYSVVELDEACRRQQAGEGWFPSFGEVPQRAISRNYSLTAPWYHSD